MSFLTWFDFLATGCAPVEAPAAVPNIISVSATVDLNGTAGSIFATGLAVSFRYPWTRGMTSGDLDNEFSMLRSECGCPGPTNIVGNPITPAEMTGPFESCIAAVDAIVTDPIEDDPGRLELYYNTSISYLGLSARIRVGANVYYSGTVGNAVYITPSTWAETLGSFSVVLDFTGMDPDGTVTFDFDIL